MIQTITTSIISALLVLALTIMAVLAFNTHQVQAQSECPDGAPTLCEVCEGAGGNWNPATSKCDPVGDVPELTGSSDSVFERVVNILTFIVGAISVVMLIVGGLRYVLSQGDANAIGAAKNTIIYAIVGMVVAFAARAIIFFVIEQLG